MLIAQWPRKTDHHLVGINSKVHGIHQILVKWYISLQFFVCLFIFFPSHSWPRLKINFVAFLPAVLNFLWYLKCWICSLFSFGCGLASLFQFNVQVSSVWRTQKCFTWEFKFHDFNYSHRLNLALKSTISGMTIHPRVWNGIKKAEMKRQLVPNHPSEVPICLWSGLGRRKGLGKKRELTFMKHLQWDKHWVWNTLYTSPSQESFWR